MPFKSHVNNMHILYKHICMNSCPFSFVLFYELNNIAERFITIQGEPSPLLDKVMYHTQIKRFL